MLYSSCELGIVCRWDLGDGQLLNQTDSGIGEAVELALSETRLIGYNGDLWIWDKQSMQLATRITPEPAHSKVSQP